MIEILTFALVVITAIYALLTYGILQSNRAAVAAMKFQIESATRPHVIIDLERKRGGFYDFKVCNCGHSAAQSLHMTCTPEIGPVAATGSVTQHGKSPDASGLFRHPITYLAPGQSTAALFGHYSGIKACYPDLSFHITLRYEGGGRFYEEAADLSLKPTDEVAHLAEYDIGEELYELRKAIERLNVKSEA